MWAPYSSECFCCSWAQGSAGNRQKTAQTKGLSCFGASSETQDPLQECLPEALVLYIPQPRKRQSWVSGQQDRKGASCCSLMGSQNLVTPSPEHLTPAATQRVLEAQASWSRGGEGSEGRNQHLPSDSAALSNSPKVLRVSVWSLSYSWGLRAADRTRIGQEECSFRQSKFPMAPLYL